MSRITFAIFNEEFWTKGLIYSQNIKPLLKIAHNHNDYEIEFISFTSLYFYFKQRNAIKERIQFMRSEGVKTHVLPVLFYPTRYMIVNWFWLPWFILNMLPYMLWQSLRDLGNKDQINLLRSYQVALAYRLLYFGRGKRIFDTRTDWIEEARGMNYWKRGDLTDKMWLSFEGFILKTFDKTLFISDAQKTDTLERCGLADEEKYCVFYNQTDYSRYNNALRERASEDFVYSGSLGHWNNLGTYLDFFVQVSPLFPLSKLYVLTPTSREKIEPVLARDKYDGIRDKVEVLYNVPFDDIPKYYGRCKYGLQLMEKADSRVGVKFVEYVAAGLVPVVHKNVRGAAYLAENMGLGVVVGDDISGEKINEIKNAIISPDAYARFRAMTDERESSEILYNYLTSKD